MHSHYFIINAPPFSLTKNNLYTSKNSLECEGTYIKAVSDAFFLSNNFRKNLMLYYCTSYNSESYIVGFDGSKLRYLGPSSFSASLLLLRAKNYLIDPKRKSGKLTPGLEVIRDSVSWVLEKFPKEKMLIIKKEKKVSPNYQKKIADSNTFLFGFEGIELSKEYNSTSLGPIDIDEQVILTNYTLETD